MQFGLAMYTAFLWLILAATVCNEVALCSAHELSPIPKQNHDFTIDRIFERSCSLADDCFSDRSGCRLIAGACFHQPYPCGLFYSFTPASPACETSACRPLPRPALYERPSLFRGNEPSSSTPTKWIGMIFDPNLAICGRLVVVCNHVPWWNAEFQ